MRLAGLTLCLLASTLGARAESVEDRVAALEARVKTLEEALRSQAAKPPVAAVAAAIDGTYRAALPNGQTATIELKEGRVTASNGQETRTGSYQIVGDKVLLRSDDGKIESFQIEGEHLKKDQVDLIKSK